MTSEPRLDAGVKYKIPGGLFRDCMTAIGFPAIIQPEPYYWVGGDFIASLLKLVYGWSDGREILGNELYNALLPEPPELQEAT